MIANDAHFDGTPITSDQQFSPPEPAGYTPSGEMTITKQHQTTLKTDHMEINSNTVQGKDKEVIKVMSNNRCKLMKMTVNL